MTEFTKTNSLVEATTNEEPEIINQINKLHEVADFVSSVTDELLLKCAPVMTPEAESDMIPSPREVHGSAVSPLASRVREITYLLTDIIDKIEATKKRIEL